MSAPSPPKAPDVACGDGKAAAAPSDSSNARYVELTRRLSSLAGSGAAAITALIVLSIWGHWREIAVIGAIQALVIPFNIWVNLVWLPRRGRTADVVRILVDLVSGVVVSRIAGWPLPVWLWLPFVALAFDHLDRRVAQWMVVGMCVLMDGAALIDGVSWTSPFIFTLFAGFCSVISRLRFSIIRDMLGESDAQRLELERMHTSLRESHEQLVAETQVRLRMESELRQAQKLEAVGRLASGVAHEINTPIQFVSDSVHFIRDAVSSYAEIIGKLEIVQQSVLAGAPAEGAASEANQAIEEGQLEYLLQRVPKALDRSLEGLSRIATIVRSMKEFAHPDGTNAECVDLNDAITSTLVIAKGEYKYVADVETHFGDLPRVMCHIGDINQVVLNLVVNAAHAIGDLVKDTEKRGRISVTTEREANEVLISIADTGGGIPAAVRDRIFDPFFTTKEVGRGTGQGLAIARSVIVDKHKGQLTFESEVGKGTTFFIRIPIADRSAADLNVVAA